MNEEEELKKALEEENKRAQEEYDEITKGNELIRKTKEGETKDDEQLDIPDLFESRSGVRRGASLAFEIGANTLVDPLSVFDPTGASQYAAGSLINYIAQKIRGGEISAGEMAAAGLASLIPGGAQGKALVKFGKGALKGAASGAIEATSVAAIDEGRLPTAGEFAASTGFGAAFGGALSTPQAQKAFKAVAKKIDDASYDLTGALTRAALPTQFATGQGAFFIPPRSLSEFRKATPIRQKFGPYPQLPVNAEVKNAVDIDAAKDDVIAAFGGKKTIRTKKGKGPLIYTLQGGEQVMFEVDLRGENGIARRDQLIAVPATEVAVDSRKVLESVPEDLEYWIENNYGPEYLDQYKTWVKGGRNRLVDVKKEMQDQILGIRAKEIQKEIKYSFKQGDARIQQRLDRFNTPENQRLIKIDEGKLEDSHILSIGKKGKLTKTGVTKGMEKAIQPSKLRTKTSPNITRNFPKGSRAYDPPAAYQSFIEYWRLNRARGAGIAVENVPEEDAIRELQELGLPTSWLEDFANFALLDVGIRKELTNKDIIKLLKQGFTAEQIIQQRLAKLAREKQLLDITDFAYKIQDLSPEDAIKVIDDRYQREILAGTRPADAFLEPPE